MLLAGAHFAVVEETLFCCEALTSLAVCLQLFDWESPALSTALLSLATTPSLTRLPSRKKGRAWCFTACFPWRFTYPCLVHLVKYGRAFTNDWPGGTCMAMDIASSSHVCIGWVRTHLCASFHAASLATSIGLWLYVTRWQGQAGDTT